MVVGSVAKSGNFKWGVHSIFAFFVVSHLLILLHSTGEGNTLQNDCPESFNCGALGPIKFPLSDANHPLCGLCMVNCSKKPVPELDLGRKQLYDIKKYLNDESLVVKDNWQGKLINSKSCDLFSRWIVPPSSSSISFTISPSLTVYKCNNISRELHRQAEDYFRGNYSSYGVCLGYTIYYTYPANHSQVPISPDDLPKNCVVLELPVVPPNGKRNPSDLISLLAEEFSIGLNVSNECRECRLKGGQCPRDTPKFQCQKGRKSYFTLILATVIPGGLFLLFCLPVLTIRGRKKWNYVSSYLRSSNTSSDPSSKADLERGSIYFGVPVFSYAELEAATNNFNPSKELGGGGFGTVYHGKLQDGREIAVKRLYEHNYKRVSQFMNEIQILTRLRHRNLVSLYGCTSRLSRELLLVYEYIPNGTVADHLRGDRAKDFSLTWPIRMNIAIETASALTYLHASDIIHRDVKTNNILLDNNFCVKVADFGLSRLFPTDVTHVSTAPQGTPGYVDPEYHQCYQLTDKSDVYSFGVVLIELISSMPAIDISRHKHEINLSNLAKNRIQNRAFNELIDPSLGSESDSSIERMTTSVAEVAFRCLQLEKEMRPTMDEVLESLKEIQDYRDENTGEIIDNVGMARNITRPPPPPERDDAMLLKNSKVLPSPDSLTDSWVSCSSTSISSG